MAERGAPAGLAGLLRHVGGSAKGLEALARVVDALPLAVVLYDASGPDYRVLHLNGAAARFAATGGAAAAGRPLQEVFNSGEPFAGLFDELRRTGAEWHARGYRNPFTGGSYDVDVFPLRDGSGEIRYFLATAVDVTDEVHDRERLDLLIDSTEVLRRPAPASELAVLAIEQLKQLLPGVEAVVGLVPADRRHLFCVRGATPGVRDRLPPDTALPLRGTPAEQAIRTGLPQDAAPTAAEAEGSWIGRLLPRGGVARIAALSSGRRLPDGRRALGVIAFLREAPTPFTPGQRQLMDEFTRRLGLALHRAELLDASHALNQRLRAAMAAAVDLAGSLEPAALIDTVLRRAAEEARADRVALFRLESEELVLEGSHDADGLVPRQAGARHPLADLPDARRALEERRPVLDGPYGGAVWRAQLPAEQRRMRRAVRVPLIADGRPVGVLVVGRRQERAFSPDDVAMLELLAGHAAAALRNARLYTSADTARRVLQAGIDTTMDLVRLLEPEKVIRRLLVRVVERIDADRILLYTLEADGSFVRAGHDRDRVLVPIGRPASPALEAQMARARRARNAVRRGPEDEEPEAPGLGHATRGVRHSVLVPLLDQDRVLGFLDVARRREPDFGEEELATMRLMGNAAVLAIRNAGLFRELSEVSRMKTQFLNMAAHELRTPLSVINGYASMLADGSFGLLPEGWEMPLSVLMEKSRELGHLIDDVLLASRLEGARPASGGERLDVARATLAAIERAGPRAEMLGAVIDLDVRPGEVLVTGHEEQVARVLDNLVNNALTYSREVPRISVALAVEHGHAVVRVEDQGRGIAAEDRERIFEQFYRVDDPRYGYPPGTGLGLFIARNLAENHGGRLVLEWSEVGAGSRFALRLPLAGEGTD